MTSIGSARAAGAGNLRKELSRAGTTDRSLFNIGRHVNITSGLANTSSEHLGHLAYCQSAGWQAVGMPEALRVRIIRPKPTKAEHHKRASMLSWPSADSFAPIMIRITNRGAAGVKLGLALAAVWMRAALAVCHEQPHPCSFIREASERTSSKVSLASRLVVTGGPFAMASSADNSRENGLPFSASRDASALHLLELGGRGGTT